MFTINLNSKYEDNKDAIIKILDAENFRLGLSLDYEMRFDYEWELSIEPQDDRAYAAKIYYLMSNILGHLEKISKQKKAFTLQEKFDSYISQQK